MNEHTDILVIGAGISGLTAAWTLHKGGRDVRVLEATGEVGGCMRSDHRDGYILEQGPFNVIVRGPAFEQLLDELSDDVRVVTADRQAGRKRFVLRGGHLMHVPSNPIRFLSSPLLSMPGRLRVVRGLFFSRPGREDDSIDAAAARRLGPEFAEVLVSAMVSGIVAGDSRKLHFRSCFPSLAQIDRRIRSPIGYALRRALVKSGSAQPRRFKGLISFEEGLGALPRAMARRLGDRITHHAIVSSVRTTEDGYSIGYELDDRAHSVTCRQLIFATPMSVTAGLLKSVPHGGGRRLESVDTSSLVVLNLGLDSNRIDHPLQGYGFLVPRSEIDVPVLGVLFADSVFPHHAPSDRRLIRVFMGGVRDPEAAGRSDDELLDAALNALSPLLGLRGDPSLVDICRDHAPIPQYELGHDEMIESLRAKLAAHQGLYLAGNFVRGVSINDCIDHAARLAEGILAGPPASSPASRNTPAPEPVVPTIS